MLRDKEVNVKKSAKSVLFIVVAILLIVALVACGTTPKADVPTGDDSSKD